MRIVYGLVDPRSLEVRYIGKSSSGLRRPLAAARRVKWEPGHKSNWIKSLLALGLSYRVQVLAVASDELELCSLEVAWIAFGRAEGWPLTNLADGGQGPFGVKRSAETKEKLAAAKRGKPRDVATKASVAAGLRAYYSTTTAEQRKKGPFTAEHIANLSAGHRGVRPSDETREKMSATRKGMRHSEESKAKMSAAQKTASVGRRFTKRFDWTGKKHSDATKAKMSASRVGNTFGSAHRGRVFTAQSLVKMSASQKLRRKKQRASSNGPRLFVNLIDGRN